MTHTANTINGTIEAVGATQTGSLDGYEFRCSCCSEIARFSFRQMAVDHALNHTNYMAQAKR
jgi:hypothetical protein